MNEKKVNGDVDWDKLFLTLAERYSWASPEAIGRLTLPQLCLYASGTSKAGRKWARKDVMEYVRRWRKKAAEEQANGSLGNAGPVGD